MRAADGDDRRLGLERARDQLVRDGDADDVLDAGQVADVLDVERAEVADRAEDDAVLAVGAMDRQAHEAQAGGDFLDLGFVGARAHDDDHQAFAPEPRTERAPSSAHCRR